MSTNETIQIEEFKSLRDEMLKWQERRFEVLKISLLTSSAVVTGAVAKSDVWDWPVAVAAVFFILGISSRLIRTFSIYTATGGSYLEVFFRSEWESRNRKRVSDYTEPSAKIPTLNETLCIVHIGIGLSSLVICYLLAGPSSWRTILFALLPSSIFFFTNLVKLYKNSYPRESLVTSWMKVKEAHAGPVVDYGKYEMNRYM
jgi:hypothetical protein